MEHLFADTESWVVILTNMLRQGGWVSQRYRVGNISLDSTVWVIVTDFFLMKLGMINYFSYCINATLAGAYIFGDKEITIENRSMNSREPLKHFEAEI